MKEFIVLMAFLTALVALAIDAMLPALGIMAGDLTVARANDIQFVISALFIGMTIGQLLYGPIADAIGRKPALYSGMALFILGSLISWHADSLPVMLFGRFVQGLGVSGPRIIVMAIVRDKYHGRDMAYVMSMVMGVFILVPAIAPSIGELIIHLADWRSIFLFYIAATSLAALWAHMRLEETLAPENRRPFSLPVIWSGIKEAARTRVTLGYTVCSGVAFGSVLGYLNSAQQIFQGLFEAGQYFALYFGMLALAFGAALFSNSRWVRRVGMRIITRNALYGMMTAAGLFFAHTLLAEPSLPIFMVCMGACFYCLGLMFGNMSAMALEPMGHMAGLASAFMGSCSSLVSMTLGAIVGQLYDGTLLPLSAGLLIFSTGTYGIMRWAEHGHIHPHHTPGH